MNKIKMPLAGWGNYPRCNSMACRPENIREINLEGSSSLIPRGLGRSYGDAALNGSHEVLLTEKLNRFISFDDHTGKLSAEAGVSFRDILDIFVPRGWFPPVTPGTDEVTLGGCVAADVHGKNHHTDGSIGRWIDNFTLLTANGKKLLCSREQNQDLFIATLGGMGLTGIIIEATLQLIPIETASMVVKCTATSHLDNTIDHLLNPLMNDKYSAAWIDGLAKGNHFGRGILITGRHALLSELSSSSALKIPLMQPKPYRFNVPWRMPFRLVNQWNVSLFNRYYYSHCSRNQEPFIDSCRNFFYPLDKLQHWNRLYGKKGFIQYQCVLPFSTARQGFAKIFETLATAQLRSYLTVLKKFGPQEEGLLSFPMEGLTLSLDIPMHSNDLLPLLDQLDSLVIDCKGRCYLAKDARMKANAFLSMYPKFGQWQRIKNQIDPKSLFSSDLSRRLGMTP